MNLDDSDCVEEFSEFVRRGGRWRNYEPAALVGQWSDFVDRCVDGFEGGLADDYFNELSSRSDLEEAMNSSELAKYPQMELVRSRVSAADEKLRAILIPDAFPNFPGSRWWLRGVVRYSGYKLADDLLRHFGISIEAL